MLDKNKDSYILGGSGGIQVLFNMDKQKCSECIRKFFSKGVIVGKSNRFALFTQVILFKDEGPPQDLWRKVQERMSWWYCNVPEPTTGCQRQRAGLPEAWVRPLWCCLVPKAGVLEMPLNIKNPEDSTKCRPVCQINDNNWIFPATKTAVVLRAHPCQDTSAVHHDPYWSFSETRVRQEWGWGMNMGKEVWMGSFYGPISFLAWSLHGLNVLFFGEWMCACVCVCTYAHLLRTAQQINIKKLYVFK